MPQITIIGSTGAVRAVTPPLVEMREHWADPWAYLPNVHLVGASADTAGQDLGKCTIRTRYGKTKDLHESNITTTLPFDYLRWWVRVSLVESSGTVIVWIGRISSERRTVHGTGSTPSGIQDWIALEPLQILRKINVSQAQYFRNGQSRLLGWVPDMNGRDERGMLVGNRSDGLAGNTFVYGDDNVWTHFEYAEYVLDSFVDEGGSSGPSWALSGATDLLDKLKTQMSFGVSMSVADMLRRLIPRSVGLDYKIVPTADGFAVHIFSLFAQPVGFENQTLTANPHHVVVRAKDQNDMLRINLVRTTDHQYDRLRVVGKRAVCCATLRATKAALPGTVASLIGKWPTALQTLYNVPGVGKGPTSDGELNDKARRADQFSTVYQLFGAPVDWDHNNNSAAPTISPSGELLPASSTEYQNAVRRTLSWTPLRADYDYTVNPPIKLATLVDYEPEFLPLAVWLLETSGPPFRVLADQAGMHVGAVGNDWGFALSARPNHLLALNHFAGADQSETDPFYDFEDIVATLAFETDQRLTLEYKIPADVPSGGALVIEDAEAELWYIAPQTVVGVSLKGELLTSPAGENIILRTDAQRLAFVMAGAIARYHNTRARAEITLQGLEPWSQLLGTILTVVETGGDTHRIEGVITSVEWHREAGDWMTTIRTGFAR